MLTLAEEDANLLTDSVHPIPKGNRMATQSKTSPVTESIDAATERVVELNEKTVANGKKAGAAILDTYEKTIVSFTESYEKAAGSTKVDWIASAAAAQADFTREVAKAYTSAARDLVS
jgi:hypothetical protein